MSWLVDTSVISELRKGARASRAVVAWWSQVDEGEVFLSSLTIGEIRKGIESVRRRDTNGAAALDRWLGRLVRDHSERILPIDQPVADVWGRINVPNPLPVIDGLLAATAIVHGLTFVTRNIADVKSTGVELVNPWKYIPE